MNDDYLWDKSGQPDPQIQELEQILAPLRYQPKPLEIPNDLLTPRRRNYLPLLAIAATVAIALITAGVWLRVRTQRAIQPHQTKATPPAVYEETPAPEVPRVVRNTDSPDKLARRHRIKSPKPVITKNEREEALAAKEQVVLALRLASEKLKLAQRKTQNPATPGQIKNQHKVG